jgi:hypothetical protein
VTLVLGHRVATSGDVPLLARMNQQLVNVLIGNLPALEFWRAVGFADYLITLEMDRSGPGKTIV